MNILGNDKTVKYLKAKTYINLMDKVLDNISNSKKHIKVADYMLTMTYETVKEPRLLLTITNTVFTAVKEAVDAGLYYERHFKRIPPFNEDSFEVKFDVFKKRLSKKYSISLIEMDFINFLRKVTQEHKESAVEFARKDDFFMYKDDYSGERLDKDTVKKLISNAKIFIDKVYLIISNKR